MPPAGLDRAGRGAGCAPPGASHPRDSGNTRRPDRAPGLRRRQAHRRSRGRGKLPGPRPRHQHGGCGHRAPDHPRPRAVWPSQRRAAARTTTALRGQPGEPARGQSSVVGCQRPPRPVAGPIGKRNVEHRTSNIQRRTKEAASHFDVGRWAFDVRRSSFPIQVLPRTTGRSPWPGHRGRAALHVSPLGLRGSNANLGLCPRK